ncbi:MAG TPA: hypothetical protein VM689_07180 [Aliidongia sp.]|nr:hypothetical protein [Aliidongia sp.]
MLEANGVSLEIVPLATGKFEVRAIGGARLGQVYGVFDTRPEAEAWILQRSMIDDEAGFTTGIIKPGDGEGVA